MSESAIPITLGKTTFSLRRTNRFQYRIGQLPQTGNEYAATINMLWALQEQRNLRNTPEDIADLFEAATAEQRENAVDAVVKIMGVDVEGEPQAESTETSPSLS